MKYDFDSSVERKGTCSINNDLYRHILTPENEALKSDYGDDIIRMWVADMDFATAPEIIEAVKERADKGIFGYTYSGDSEYVKALRQRCRDLYAWDFNEEELCFSEGVKDAIKQILELVAKPTDKVMFNTPAYGPYKEDTNMLGLTCVTSDLKKDETGYHLDLEDMRKKADDPDVRFFLLCNPHNPTGRMWNEEELKDIAELVREKDMWIISDEIHCDIIREGRKHIPMDKIMKGYDKLITCMANSKTFNLAGMKMSHTFIKNEELRKLYREKKEALPNPLSLEANRAAIEKGTEWMAELNRYIDGNMKYFDEFLKENIPEAVTFIPEGTYLAWADLSKAFPGVASIGDYLFEKAGIAAEEGNRFFVGNAEGHLRFNLAMPAKKLEEGLKRIASAYQKLKLERK